MDDVLTLIAYTRTQDAVGIWRETLSSQRTVFCKVNSVTRNEFYAGGRSGLNPEFEFVVAAPAEYRPGVMFSDEFNEVNL